jgi:hypothetical protein
VSDTNDKRETIKEIRNTSVKLLELLNVLIPKVDAYNATISTDLLDDVSNECFKLGASIAQGAEHLAEKDDELNGYPFGM